MPIPATMQHIAVHQPGPPEALVAASGPVPAPGPGEVLIEVAYAGVNRPDCLQRSGAYPPPADASPIIGLEVSGRIAALGDGVADWKVGDEVCALTPGGGYAEYCATPGRLLPADSRRPVAAAGGRAAGDAFHGLVQPVRTGPPRRRRVAAGPRRHQRHRPDRDPARPRVRRHGDRHRGFAGKGRLLPGDRRRLTRSTTGRRISLPR